MLLFTIVSAAIVLGQDQTITYSTVAKPLGAVLGEISTQTHEKYQVDEILVNQPIIIDVKGAHSSELLSRIAKVCYGKWVSKEGFKALVIDNDAVQDARKAWHDKLAKTYADALDKKLKKYAKEGPFTAQSAHTFLDFAHNMMQKVSQMKGPDIVTNAADFAPPTSLPNQRAVMGILEAIGPDALANIEDGDRVVYSTNANRLQVALDSSSPVITQYVQDEKVWNQVVSSLPKVQLDPQALGALGPTGMADPEVMDSFMSSFLKGPDSIGKIDLSIKNDGGTLTATLDVLDAQGKLGDTTPGILDPNGIDLTDPGDLIKLMKPGAQSAESDKFQIPLTPESRAFQGAQESVGMTGMPRQAIKAVRHMAGGFGAMLFNRSFKIPPGMRADMLRPDKHDPLSWDVSELVNGLAEHQSSSMVAMIPDSELDIFQGDGTSASAVENDLNLAPDLGIVRGPNWIQISALNPDALLHHRVDRKELARLLTSLDTSKASAFDSLGAYYLVHPNDNDTIIDRYLSACDLQLQAGMFGTSNKVTCELYAAIDETNREKLRNGEKLHVADLSPTFAHALADFVYSGNPMAFMPDIEPMIPTPPAQDGSEPAQPAPAFDPDTVMASVRSMFSEPTENFPNGIPQDGVVEMRETSEVGAKSADQGAEDTVLSPDTIAWMKQPKGASNGLPDELQQPLPKTFRVVQNVTLTFNITLGKRHATFTYSDAIPMGDETYTWENAPQDFKDAIKKAEDALKSGSESVTTTTPTGPTKP